jgi:hypothetical protein
VKNGGCSELCVDTPGSYYCDCKHGFKLVGNSTCDGRIRRKKNAFNLIEITILDKV